MMGCYPILSVQKPRDREAMPSSSITSWSAAELDVTVSLSDSLTGTPDHCVLPITPHASGRHASFNQKPHDCQGCARSCG